MTARKNSPGLPAPPAYIAGCDERPAGSWGISRPTTAGEGNYGAREKRLTARKHLFTKDGCFLTTPQLTPEPIGSAITVSHASSATYRQARYNKPRIIDRASTFKNTTSPSLLCSLAQSQREYTYNIHVIYITLAWPYQTLAAYLISFVQSLDPLEWICLSRSWGACP